MKNTVDFEKNSFANRIKTMLKVDFRRMFSTPFVYIVLGVCLVVPILILVMTTMMDGTVTVAFLFRKNEKRQFVKPQTVLISAM